MTEDNSTLLRNLIFSTLDERKALCGKRFSTYHEAQAHLVVDTSNATDELKRTTQALEFMWEKLKNDSHDEEYYHALNAMHASALLATAELITLIADIEKLTAGVVHEPKAD